MTVLEEAPKKQEPAPAKKPAPKRKAGAYYSFLPKNRQRGGFIRFIRKFHAWIGLWGSLLLILFGMTGIFLNHHSVLPLPIAQTEEIEYELEVPESARATPKAYQNWLVGELGIERHTVLEIKKMKPALLQDEEVEQPNRWRVKYHTPSDYVEADYYEGNTYATIMRGDHDFLKSLAIIHRGKGMPGVGWVLLADSAAIGFVLLALSGVLLWTRLNGSRILAAILVGGSLGIGAWAMIYSIAG